MDIGERLDIPTIPRIIENGNGAWRLNGNMTGPDIFKPGGGDLDPGIAQGTYVAIRNTTVFPKHL